MFFISSDSKDMFYLFSGFAALSFATLTAVVAVFSLIERVLA
jgi:hypothetical protein